MLLNMDSHYFTEEKLIERIECSNLEYNTEISYPENCDVVVISNGTIRRLRKIDNDIVNPSKGLFHKKLDPSNYIIFFVDKAYQDASWGGNIIYEDYKVDEIQEKINIRANFTFKIVRGDRVISLLSETKKHYSKRYLVDKIRLKISNAIKQYVYKILKEKGFVEAQEDILNVTKKTMELVNDDVLSVYGIEMSNLNLILEEDMSHASRRNKAQWKNYHCNKEETNND